jgi:hypothetical protein
MKTEFVSVRLKSGRTIQGVITVAADFSHFVEVSVPAIDDDWETYLIPWASVEYVRYLPGQQTNLEE